MTGRPSLIDQIYSRIREIGLLFPIAAPTATVDVGTYDAAADRFTFSQAVKRVTGRFLIAHPANRAGSGFA